MVRVALLPGDGIGPEVLEGPVSLLRNTIAENHPVEVSGPWPVGASALPEHGVCLPPETIAACEDADVILLGAVGEHPGVATRPGQAERALLDLREHFELRVSIREIWRGARPAVVVLRNLLGGAYGPASARVESDGTTAAQDVLVIEPARVRELADIAMRLLEPRPGWSVLSVDKANLWATSRLWRRQVTESFGERRVPVEHVLVDRAAFQLADDQFDEVVLLTEGIFGDVLSDLAAGRSGSIAMCASGSIHPGDPVRGRCTGLFEPVHGSAPRHVGADRVNPVGAYLALAAVLEWFPATAPAADAVRRAVRSALLSGPFTYDLADAGAPVASCSAFSRRINELYGETG